jgi:CheY-like chemotaxis protein/anti-sigma regulatory factor (Ser/Thr protein kinase)
MTKILIVDDSPVDRQLVGKLLERRRVVPDLEHPVNLVPVYAESGDEALELIDREEPEAVVTDLQMPGMSGLELVGEVRARYPGLPVILMTAHGNEDIAVEALRRGAASYVPKKDLARDLVGTVESVLAAAQAQRARRALMACLMQTESQFALDNDPALIRPLVGHLKANFAEITGCDGTTLIRLAVALREALVNAMDHGNLELDSALREQGESAYQQLGEERRRQAPYKGRLVHVTARETPREAVYVIRDEGPGFDPSRLPDPRDPANLGKSGGRGLLLIQTFMSEVRHNPQGNEIILVRRVEDA